MKRYSKKPPLGQVIDIYIQHRIRLNDTGNDAANQPVVFLQHQDIVGTDESHGRWQAQSRRNLGDNEIRIGEGWSG